jgi:hypothetical protein
MKDYFSAKPLHLEDRCLISAAPQIPLLATYGVDNLIVTLNPLTQQEQRYELSQQEVHSAMALAPDGSHLLFGKLKTTQLSATASANTPSRPSRARPSRQK